MELATELKLSEKEVILLAFIWLANGVKIGAIKNIRNCKLISQDKLAKKWSRENRGKPTNPSVKKLKEDISLTQELYEFGVVDLAEIFQVISTLDIMESISHKSFGKKQRKKLRNMVMNLLKRVEKGR